MATKNNTIDLLKATTAVIAITVASPVFAGDSWVSVEGGLSNMSTSYYGYGYPVGFSGTYASSISGSAAAEFGFHIGDGPYSVSFGTRTSADIGLYSYGGSYSYFDGAATATIDFEVGRDISLGGIAEGRVTLGVRGAAIGAGRAFVGTVGYGYGSGTSFVGAGPRIGVEASVPVAGNLSVDIEAGAAMLFGTETDFGASGYVSSPSTYSYSQSTTVTNLDFSAALSYLIGSKSKVSLGYRVEQFSGLDGYTYFNGGVDTIIDQGAFLKFTTTF